MRIDGERASDGGHPGASRSLLVFPRCLGAGPRLFAENVQTKFSLVESEAYDNEALHLVLRPVS